MRVAIVTPYFKEPRPMLERCLRSVAAQTVPATHFVIADGHPQAWLDEAGVRHLPLDRSHGDYGNTPRAVGGLLAASEGFDAIGFIDADNWLDPDHVETCLRTAAQEGDGLDYVIARRRLTRDDGSVMPIQSRDDLDGSLVDTNCYFMLPGSFHTLGRWGVMPKPLSIVGDRVFLRGLQAQELKAARTSHATVNYLCTWAVFFTALGETPPDYAKGSVDLRSAARWWQGLDARDRQIVERLAAAPLNFLEPKEALS